MDPLDDYELPDEIDFSQLKRVPNPFIQDFRGLNLVSLDPDVKASFPDSESVNGALRRLLYEQGTSEEPSLSKAG